jgi:hypothetical protein
MNYGTLHRGTFQLSRELAPAGLDILTFMNEANTPPAVDATGCYRCTRDEEQPGLVR